MRLFGKKINELTSDDFNRVIENKVSESLVLDYKLELHKPNNEGKRELLADVSAMANTSGGILLFGIREAMEDGHNAGYPEEIVGITDRDGTALNVEQLKQWLDGTIRDGIDPRIHGLEYQEYEFEGKLLFAIAVPRSLQAPHMVKFDGLSRFYSRGNTGKFQMDVMQIRQAFNRTSNWRESADRFRDDRIKTFLDMPYDRTPGMFFHVVPLGERELLEINGKVNEITGLLPSTGYGGYSPAYNLDGIIKRTTGSLEYIQVFRNGGIESFEIIFSQTNEKGQFELLLEQFTIFAMKHLHFYQNFSQQYTITPPFAVYLSAVNMSGGYIRNGYGNRPQFAGGRDELHLPGILIDDANANIHEAIRGTFDILYQSCGRQGCPSYSQDGVFTLDYRED